MPQDENRSHRQEKPTAQLAKSTTIGVTKVSYNGKLLTEISVVELEEVLKSSFFSRLRDTMRLWMA